MAENFFNNLKITDNEWNAVKVAGNSVRPNSKSAYGTGLTPEDTKKIFDKGPELIRERFNKLADYAFEEEGKRISAESDRKNAEKNRDTKEKERQSAEEERRATFEAAEAGRQNTFGVAEAGRQTTFDEAEAERQATFEAAEAERDRIVGDLNEVIDAIIAIQESLIGGGE